ncbi:MAG: hypothetical protein WKF80_11035 [Thermomicrobiales bacterium]
MEGLEVFEGGALPRWALVRQRLDATRVGDVAAAVAVAFDTREARDAIGPGTRVALTAGSRGIDRVGEVLAAAVARVRAFGGDPFVVPAMGSHGGATAEGQLALLDHYGMTPETLGCPIHASMETVLLGEVEDGVPVWFDRIAHERADVVIPVGRVKPHTDFHGPVESGLMKMLAIGLGKQKGAEAFHRQGFADFHHLIPAVGSFILGRVNVPFGLALIENGHGELAIVEAVPGPQMWRREQVLLAKAKTMMPHLPGEAIDLLLIDRIGKDVSGSGADPNVINRDLTGLVAPAEAALKPRVQRIVIRDLTDETEGNATGIGLADIALRRAVDKMDPVSSYMNVITAKSPAGVRVPLTVANDRQALAIGLACCVKVRPETARIARIADTKHLDRLWVSEAFLADLAESPDIEPLSDLRDIAFDAAGMLSDQL